MRVIYYILLWLINFIIYIGDATRFLLLIPFKFLQFLYRYVLRTIRLLITGIRSLVHWRPKRKKGRIIAAPQFYPQQSISPKKRRFKLFLNNTKYFIVGFVLAAFIFFIYSSYILVKSLPSPRSIGKVNYPLSTHIVDRNGKLLYEFYRDENRTPIHLADLPSYVYQASIAIEDKDFFYHNGISPVSGIARAIKEFVVTKKIQGGSTITQQLVKSALLTPERTVQRKIKEIILALWTERLFSKQQILEMYLNQVPYGGSAYGIEEAAQTYFNKSAKNLTLDEAALLAGLPQAPSIYSPFVDPQSALNRRNDVLKKMYEQNYITKDVYERSVKINLPIINANTPIKAPHFVFYVKSELEKQFNIHTVEEGGLRVQTSLDLSIQQQAEQILREEIEKIKNLNVTNGGILVTRPATGEILAMVGSTDYFASPSGAFNVTTALRQPGSSIKPLMYSLALEKGMTAATILDDSPVVYTNPWGESYSPVNYDGKFHGKIPLRIALANSFNIPAVRTLNSIGVQQFVHHAQDMGITTWNDSSQFGLSLTLGGGEVNMIDMATAYGVFSNLGKRVNLDPLIQVTDTNDEIVYDHQNAESKVLDNGIAYILSDILSDNNARQLEFGAHSALEIPGYKVSVKTGTTDNKKDNWTIGYTPEFLVAVWVGNNNNEPMNQQLASGITGAAPIWNRVMTYLLTTYSNKNTWFNKPDDVVEKPCYGNKKEYFLRGTEQAYCQSLPSTTPTPSVK